MRRSKMIEVLADAIKMGVYVNENNGHLVCEDKEVGYILDQLVAAGMLPPNRSVLVKRVGPCWEVETDEVVNTWDDE